MLIRKYLYFVCDLTLTLNFTLGIREHSFKLIFIILHCQCLFDAKVNQIVH